jgi:broad specificity phosphatase PhoE
LTRTRDGHDINSWQWPFQLDESLRGTDERVFDQTRRNRVEPDWPPHRYDRYPVDRERAPAGRTAAPGTRQRERLRPVLAKEKFARVLVSPMQRARETCDLAGFGNMAAVDPDLGEWNYGRYEGLRPQQIQQNAPGWLIFRDGCLGGETPAQVGARVDRVIAKVRAVDGDVALFAHVLRVLGARWIGLQPGDGTRFLLDTGTLSVLGYYREIPAVKIWNAAVAG